MKMSLHVECICCNFWSEEAWPARLSNTILGNSYESCMSAESYEILNHILSHRVCAGCSEESATSLRIEVGEKRLKYLLLMNLFRWLCKTKNMEDNIKFSALLKDSLVRRYRYVFRKLNLKCVSQIDLLNWIESLRCRPLREKATKALIALLRHAVVSIDGIRDADSRTRLCPAFKYELLRRVCKDRSLHLGLELDGSSFHMSSCESETVRELDSYKEVITDCSCTRIRPGKCLYEILDEDFVYHSDSDSSNEEESCVYGISGTGQRERLKNQDNGCEDNTQGHQGPKNRCNTGASSNPFVSARETSSAVKASPVCAPSLSSANKWSVDDERRLYGLMSRPLKTNMEDLTNAFPDRSKDAIRNKWCWLRKHKNYVKRNITNKKYQAELMNNTREKSNQKIGKEIDVCADNPSENKSMRPNLRKPSAATHSPSNSIGIIKNIGELPASHSSPSDFSAAQKRPSGPKESKQVLRPKKSQRGLKKRDNSRTSSNSFVSGKETMSTASASLVSESSLSSANKWSVDDERRLFGIMARPFKMNMEDLRKVFPGRSKDAIRNKWRWLRKHKHYIKKNIANKKYQAG